MGGMEDVKNKESGGNKSFTCEGMKGTNKGNEKEQRNERQVTFNSSIGVRRFGISPKHREEHTGIKHTNRLNKIKPVFSPVRSLSSTSPLKKCPANAKKPSLKLKINSSLVTSKSLDNTSKETMKKKKRRRKKHHRAENETCPEQLEGNIDKFVVESSGRMRWRKLRRLVRLMSIMREREDPSLLVLRNSMNSSSPGDCAQLSVLFHKYHKFHDKRGERRRRVARDRFIQHSQERWVGVGESYIHTMGVHWGVQHRRDWSHVVKDCKLGVTTTRDPQNVSSHVSLPWNSLVEPPPCVTNISHSVSCMSNSCTVSIQSGDTHPLHQSIIRCVYSLLCMLLSPAIAAITGAYLGILLFLHLWLVRPLMLAVGLQYSILGACVSPAYQCVLVPLARIWSLTLSIVPLPDIITASSPLVSVFVRKPHTENWDWKTCGAGRKLGETNNGLVMDNFSKEMVRKKSIDKLGTQGEQMVDRHMDWRDKVTVLSEAVSMARNGSKKNKMDIKGWNVSEVNTVDSNLANPITVNVEVEYVTIDIDSNQRVTKTKKTGEELWKTAWELAMAHRHRKEPQSFMDKARDIVFTHTKKDNIVKLF